MNASVVHPLFFMLRRVLFAVLIVTISSKHTLIASFLMLYMTLAMLIIAATGLPWTVSLINSQHIVNEMVFYIVCASLVTFSGATTDVHQLSTLGWLLVGLIMLFCLFNVLVIVYDNLINLKQLIRYKKLLPK